MRLNALLAASAAARRVYRQSMYALALLEKFGVVDGEAAQHDEPSAVEKPDALVEPRRALWAAWSRPTPVSITAAAMVMALLVTAMYFMAPPFYRAITGRQRIDNDAAPVIVAQLTGIDKAVWAPGQIGAHQGAHLIVGHRMELLEGLAEVTYESGARVTLQGPATLVVQGANAARLPQGKLVARVPQSAVGFEVETPSAMITDLGTEFGVDVEDEQVEAHVFVGEVLVQAISPEQNQSAPIRISAGQAVRIEGDGSVKRALSADAKQFPQRHGFVNLARGKSVIAASDSWPGGGAVDARFLPDFVVDGRIDESQNSYWLGSEKTENQHVTIDLGQAFQLERIELVQTHNGISDDRGTKEFELWAGSEIDDRRALVEPVLIAKGTLPNAIGTGARLPVHVVSLADGNLTAANARYLHFVAKTYYGLGTGLSEIRVFGQKHSTINKSE
jgi:hypothetical protein